MLSLSSFKKRLSYRLRYNYSVKMLFLASSLELGVPGSNLLRVFGTF